MSEVQCEFPKVCELCGQKIGSRIDLDWHGLGNCAPICDACSGSGIEDKAALNRIVSERTKALREALEWALDHVNPVLIEAVEIPSGRNRYAEARAILKDGQP